MPANDRDKLTVGLAQIAPVWLDREATLAKVVDWIGQAAAAGCGFVAFGEALVPGYPFWIEHTDGARFDSSLQKDTHAHYLDQAIQVEAGHLDGVCAAARLGIAVMLGTIERPADRGGHSVYCSRVHIGADGKVASVHRKLLPTYEERLSWAPGDGHGLQVHPVGPFTVGGLNCYENWMPLSRAALYAQGEDLHVALPVTGREHLIVAALDHREVRRERQNFDVAGHYARPDVTRLVVDRRRQSLASFRDGPVQ